MCKSICNEVPCKRISGRREEAGIGVRGGRLRRAGSLQDGAELPGEGWDLLGEGRHMSKLVDAPTDIYIHVTLEQHKFELCGWIFSMVNTT